MHIGGDLLALGDMLGTPQVVVLNGAEVFVGAKHVDLSVKQVLDRFEQYCEEHGEGSRRSSPSSPNPSARSCLLSCAIRAGSACCAARPKTGRGSLPASFPLAHRTASRGSSLGQRPFSKRGTSPRSGTFVTSSRERATSPERTWSPSGTRDRSTSPTCSLPTATCPERTSRGSNGLPRRFACSTLEIVGAAYGIRSYATHDSGPTFSPASSGGSRCSAGGSPRRRRRTTGAHRSDVAHLHAQRGGALHRGRREPLGDHRARDRDGDARCRAVEAAFGATSPHFDSSRRPSPPDYPAAGRFSHDQSTHTDGLGRLGLAETCSSSSTCAASKGTCRWERVTLLVALKRLKRGTLITEDLLSSREIPVAYVEDRAIKANERIKSSASVPPPRCRRRVSMWTDLASASEERDLSSLVQPGERAVTVRASSSDEKKSNALLRPGDYVDVLATVSDSASKTDGDSGRSVVLLQRILVLAIGLDTEPQAERLPARQGAGPARHGPDPQPEPAGGAACPSPRSADTSPSPCATQRTSGWWKGFRTCRRPRSSIPRRARRFRTLVARPAGPGPRAGTGRPHQASQRERPGD